MRARTSGVAGRRTRGGLASAWFGIATLLVGCAPPDVELLITSPAPGAELSSGAPLLLSAEATVDGHPVEVAPAWTAPEWSGQGNDLAVADLPVGAYDLVASAVIEGIDVQTSIPIEVIAVPIDYSGVLDVKIDIDSPSTGAFTLDCVHEYLDFTVAPEGGVTGEGACSAYGERVFAITGAVVGDAVSGEMTSEGQAMPFEGTRAGDGEILCSFDYTWTEGEGSLRVYGSFTAAPVADGGR